jgi:hypothetical protein
VPNRLSLVGVVAAERCTATGDAFILLGLLFVVLPSILVLVVAEFRWTRLTVFQNSVLCSNLASYCPAVILGSLIKVNVTFLQISIFPASYKTRPFAGKVSLPVPSGLDAWDFLGLFFRKKASYEARNIVFNAVFLDKMCTFFGPNSRGREKIGNEQLRYFFLFTRCY